ncbi:MAG: hypothetical protein K2G03_01275 [Bacilli bacterium]|nr:hypothetical protein [Bacilli bacterium]MDE6141212.1 hypothetical protein [Bacilli bacterium]
MYSWLLSVVLVILSDKVCTALMKAKLKKMGYLRKKVEARSLLTTIIAWILVLTPYLNLVLLATILGSTAASLVSDKFLLKHSETSRHSASDVKEVYEARPIKKEVLKDAMTLDGADEKVIEEEMKKVDTFVKGIVSSDDLISVVHNCPDYTEEEYNWACAQYNAEMLVKEIEFDASLDDKQKAQLLKLFRDGYLEEIEGKESKTDVVKKALNIVK